MPHLLTISFWTTGRKLTDPIFAKFLLSYFLIPTCILATFCFQWLLRFEFVIAKDPSSIKFQPFIDENGDVTSIGQVKLPILTFDLQEM